TSARGKHRIKRLELRSRPNHPARDGRRPRVSPKAEPLAAIRRGMSGLVVAPYPLPVVALGGCFRGRDPELPHVKAHGRLCDAQLASDRRLRHPLSEQGCDGLPSLGSRTPADVSGDNRASLNRAVPGTVRNAEPSLAFRRAVTKLVEAPDLVPIV